MTPTAGDAGTHGPHGNTERRRDVGVLHAHDVAEHHCGSELRRELGQCRVEVEPIGDAIGEPGCVGPRSVASAWSSLGIGRRPRRRNSSSALFAAMRCAQVRTAERPSNVGSARTMEMSASWVVSSASASLAQIRRQTAWTWS